MRDNILAIVYTSNTGFTRRYAQLLGQETGLPVFDLRGPDCPPRGASVVYLGWLRAGSLQGLKQALARWTVPLVCAVGMTDPASVQAQDLAPGRQVFYLQGGLAPERLTGLNKFIIGLVGKAAAKRPPDAGDPGGSALNAFAHGADWVTAEALLPAVAWLGQ